ncbi:hypothetical protein F4801DRAFT_579243 [Xylaria longipes]|nr:hypothetical protein F4801DRAFT_579243 [Xylaria longipes]
MVKSLVTQHFSGRQDAFTKDDQTDLVRGKGNELILLLHGAPSAEKATTTDFSKSHCFGETLKQLLEESIFFRVLKYYAGILFLATNGINDLAEAFTTHINIPELDDLKDRSSSSTSISPRNASTSKGARPYTA